MMQLDIKVFIHVLYDLQYLLSYWMHARAIEFYYKWSAIEYYRNIIEVVYPFMRENLKWFSINYSKKMTCCQKGGHKDFLFCFSSLAPCVIITLYGS